MGGVWNIWFGGQNSQKQAWRVETVILEFLELGVPEFYQFMVYCSKGIVRDPVASMRGFVRADTSFGGLRLPQSKTCPIKRTIPSAYVPNIKAPELVGG